MMLERVLGIFMPELDPLQKERAKGLSREIEGCLKYFQKHSVQPHHVIIHDQVHLVAGNGIRIGKTDNHNEYFIQKRFGFDPNVNQAYSETLTVDKKGIRRKRINHAGEELLLYSGNLIDGKEYMSIVDKIHNITIPYSDHVRSGSS